MPAFNILIVGGGLGGLTAAVALSQAGHKVKVLESTAKLQTIGGGITIPSNSCRVWDHLGLLDRLLKAAEAKGPEKRTFKRYNGEWICDASRSSKVYKYDAVAIHRAPLQMLLVDAATEAGAEIIVNTRVSGIDESGRFPVAITRDGRRIEADLIIGADGAKSTLRSILHPNVDLSSSVNCYRAVIPGTVLRADPDTAPIVELSTVWWGSHRTIVGIPVQGGAFYSLECTHPGATGTAGDWNKRGDHELMKATFSDFEPLVQNLISKVSPDDLLVWKLNQLPELDSWSFKSGKLVLIADAAHALMPFSGQGHAMAAEDGACLALCLSRCFDETDIPQALKAFETIRKPRIRLLAEFAIEMARIYQLPDGPEQQKRDEGYRQTPFFSSPAWDGRPVDDVPGLPPDPLFFPYLLAHDVIEFTERQLDEIWVTRKNFD